MTIFVKLGGCNGSGKTGVVRAVLGITKATPYQTDAKKVFAYRGAWAEVPVWVLGSYLTACGGMDSMGLKEDLRALFHDYVNKPGIIIGEGLIFGKTYGYFGEWLYEHQTKKRKTLWAFMGTPFEECAERVENRRFVAAGLKGKKATPFDPERTMRQTFTIMERLEAGVRNGKYPIDGEVLRLEYKPGRQPATHAKQLLKKALEMHNANR